MLGKSTWYSGLSILPKVKWRQQLPSDWNGARPPQHTVPGMKYTTLIQVPSSANGRLLKMLSRAESRKNPTKKGGTPSCSELQKQACINAYFSRDASGPMSNELQR